MKWVLGDALMGCATEMLVSKIENFLPLPYYMQYLKLHILFDSFYPPPDTELLRNCLCFIADLAFSACEQLFQSSERCASSRHQSSR